MKYFIKKIYLILLLITVLLFSNAAFSKNTKFQYSKDDISNYFSGIISLNKNYTTAGFKYLSKVKSLKKHILTIMHNLFARLFYLKNLSKHLLSLKVYGLRMNHFLKSIFC